MVFDGYIEYKKNDEERANLRLHPIQHPTLGHLAMLPLGTEGALIDFNAKHGDRAITGFIVTQTFRDEYEDLAIRHGRDTPVGVTVLLYVLPDQHEGPLP